MTEIEVQAHIAEALRELPLTAQVSVLQYAKSLKKPKRPVGIPGKDLAHLAGTLSDEEAEQFLAAIEETCEQVHPDDWKFPSDTNVIVALLRNEKGVLENVAAAELVAIPSPVLGELYLGALRSAKVAENLAKVDWYAKEFPILDVDLQTAREWGILKNDLYQIGKPIPENDIWIAALAKQHQCTLVTRDAHFELLPAISRVRW